LNIRSDRHLKFDFAKRVGKTHHPRRNRRKHEEGHPRGYSGGCRPAFGEDLQDYVNANCCGDREVFLDGLGATVSDTDAGHTSGVTALCDLMNPAMDIINEWLASGGAVRDLASDRTR